jgi:hypothetical protein
LPPFVKRPLSSEVVIWRAWVKTKSNQKGLSFKLKSYLRDEAHNPIDPNHLEQDYFSIRGQLLWWNQKEEEDKNFAIRIAPNDPEQCFFIPFFLVIYGEISALQVGAFWDVTATREGNRLVLLEGKEVYPPKKKSYLTKTVVETVTTDQIYTQIIKVIGKDIAKSTVARWLSQGKIQERLASYCGKAPFEVEFLEKSGNKNFYHLKRTVKKKNNKHQKKKKRSTVQSKPVNEKSEPSQTTEQISTPKIMVKGRIPEITIKFNQRIELPNEGKKVSIEVEGENQIRVRAMLNRKTLKKQVAKMDEFEEWVGALSGKITQVLPDGVIELEGAGLQVFEKKKKKSETELNNESGTEPTQQTS